MEHTYLLPLRHPSIGDPSQHHGHNDSAGGFSFDYEITDEDLLNNDDDSPSLDDSPTEFAGGNGAIRRSSSSRRNSGSYKPYGSDHRSRNRPFKAAQPWPCRPCGLLLGASHILLGLSVIVFDVTTNWITETVFAITAGICFVNSGIVGLIAARKLDRGTVTLFVIFSMLSLGLCFVLIIECSAALNHACLVAAAGSASASATIDSESPSSPSTIMLGDRRDPIGYGCARSVEARVRAALLILALLESVVGVVSIFVGAKSLCNRYAPDLRNPSSPYQALIYGDLVPPARPKRIVQEVGLESSTMGNRRSSSRLLLEYLVPSSPDDRRSSTGRPEAV